MEPIDPELDALLDKWRVPTAPARLRRAVFTPWWRRSIRVPLPLAAALVLVLGLVAWKAASPPPPPKIIVKTVTVPAPLPAERPLQFRPVNEIHPRVIRGTYAAQ